MLCKRIVAWSMFSGNSACMCAYMRKCKEKVNISIVQFHEIEPAMCRSQYTHCQYICLQAPRASAVATSVLNGKSLALRSSLRSSSSFGGEGDSPSHESDDAEVGSSHARKWQLVMLQRVHRHLLINASCRWSPLMVEPQRQSVEWNTAI